MRPNNRSTMINDDLVGTTHDAASTGRWCNGLSTSGARIIGEVNVEADGRRSCRCGACRCASTDRVVAVMVRLQGPLRGPASLYEQAYLSIFERLCVMVADSTFPFREDGVAGPGLPRVGDGIILIDGDGRVEFATPNATNALHRMGVYAPTEGRTLPELGLRVRVVERSLEYALPAWRRSTRPRRRDPLPLPCRCSSASS